MRRSTTTFQLKFRYFIIQEIFVEYFRPSHDAEEDDHFSRIVRQRRIQVFGESQIVRVHVFLCDAFIKVGNAKHAIFKFSRLLEEEVARQF